MEVVVQSPSTVDNFDLSSVMISPYLSAPSSPKRFGEYYAEFYQEFDFISSSSSSSNIPFEAPTKNMDGDDDGFAFYVSDELDKWSLSAEELFDGGKIKPFKPKDNEIISSHITTIEGKKSDSRSNDNLPLGIAQRGRGRDKTPASVLSTSSSGRRVSRSHSPYRISQYTWEQQKQQQQPQEQEQPHNKKEKSTLKSTAPFSNTIASSKGSSRRWRLKDFILFRSASEGRESSKESFKKESIGIKKGEVGNGSMRRKGPISAHEMHYAMKRAESEDLKKKTFLPYKQGILSRLAGFGL
ncbi:hypothetical protein TanjilG_14669 [Lupinus angustifolius]|uniref:Uncharacterized protein n=1 Tax=Lupinus angustifolius TaxID=3871 RepID=A0A1J7GSQ3_LUPAN|nr:PREDICTED: uncharacterized protein LOC109357838 [Lupinus angustifolius]OIW03444.1 hypothetical protein TanjilG_14669 [Lupinus angustifolius]